MTSLYGHLYRSLLFPLWENGIRRRPTLRHLRFLRQTERASLDELVALQNVALGRLVAHAYENVPFYRERMRADGIGPADIRTAEDLAALSPLSRDEARESFEQRKSTAPPLPEVYKMTSGTTGQPLAFGYDRGSEYWRQAVKLRGYGWAGYRPGEPSLHFWGALDALYAKAWSKKVKVGLDRGLRRELYADSNRRSDESLAAVVGLIEKHRPTVLVCFSQAGAALAHYVLEHDLRRWGPLPVICGAEKVFPHDRKALEAAFGPVFETYGSREVMLIGTECEAHDGLHVSMENLIVEVLVHDAGGLRPAAPGETGEIAVTDLHNYGIPFIRYLTGDLGVWKAAGACACGRQHVRLASIEGRCNDTLRDRDGSAVDSLFFNVMFSVLADKVRHFQAVQRKDGSVDLKIVPTAAFDEATLDSLKQISTKFLRGVELRAHVVPHIPVEKNGKLRVVVVEQ